MNASDSMYTVKDVADLAGVSVRTLHHYDEIGLLRPADRNEAGYRLYGRPELLTLQQILFYRELDIPLAEIRTILIDRQFDQLQALQSHRRALRARARRLATLIETIDDTIRSIKGEETMLTDKDLYKGFTKEQIAEYKAESQERWGDEYAQVDANVRRMSKEQWQAIQDQGEAVNRALAALVDHDPTDAAVQEAVGRHHAWLENFYPVDAERYRGLAEMYGTDERFTATYEKYATGLAQFLSAAMKHYADTRLA